MAAGTVIAVVTGIVGALSVGTATSVVASS